MAARKIALNTLFLSVARFAGMLFSFAIILLVSRLLGPESLGQYNLALAIAAFFIVFSDAGISTIIVRELSKKNPEKDFFSEALDAKALLAALSFALAAVVSVLFFQRLDSALFVFLVVSAIVVDSFSFAFRKVFEAFQEMHLEAITFVLQKFLFALAAALLFLFGYGLVGIAVALLFANLVSLFFSAVVFFSLKKKPSFSLAFFKPKVILFSSVLVPFVLIGLLDMLSTKIDFFIVGYFLGESALGLYSAPRAVFDALFVVQLSLFSALFPQLSFLFHSEKKKLSPVVSRILKFLLVFSAPVAIVSIVFSQSIVALFFGAQFLEAAAVFAISSVLLAFLLLLALFSSLLFIANRQSVVAVIFAVSITVTILSAAVLVPSFGINGMAFSVLAASIVSFLLSFFSSRGIAQIDFSFLPRFVFCCAICFPFVFLFSLLQGAFALFLGSAFAVLFFFLFCLDKNEKTFLLDSLGLNFFGGFFP